MVNLKQIVVEIILEHQLLLPSTVADKLQYCPSIV